MHQFVRITLTLFGHLARYLPATGDRGKAVIEVGAGQTVSDVLDSVGLPESERGYVTVNGRRASLQSTLSDGDEVRVIVPLGGG